MQFHDWRQILQIFCCNSAALRYWEHKGSEKTSQDKKACCMLLRKNLKLPLCLIAVMHTHAEFVNMSVN